MPATIFISYRRTDSPGVAGWLLEHMRHKLPRASIFLDVDAIKPGRDFRQVLLGKVAEANVLLAVIGPNWIAPGADGKRRIDDDNDYVRIELARALELEIPVIPVLIDATPMPRADELPANIRDLAHLQAHNVRQTSFRADAAALANIVSEIMPDTAAPSAPSGAVAWKRPAALIAMAICGAAVALIAVLSLKPADVTSTSEHIPDFAASPPEFEQRPANEMARPPSKFESRPANEMAAPPHPESGTNNNSNVPLMDRTN